MDPVELAYHIDTLKECDPNYVVDVLGVSSEELIAAFYEEAVNFIIEDQE